MEQFCYWKNLWKHCIETVFYFFLNTLKLIKNFPLSKCPLMEKNYLLEA